MFSTVINSETGDGAFNHTDLEENILGSGLSALVGGPDKVS